MIQLFNLQPEMIEITKAYKQHIPNIRELAEQLWPVAFASILSAKQIEYMMEMMYSPASLAKQMQEGHQYAIASLGKQDIGYVSYEIDHHQSNQTKIHKLYISPHHQRHGVGKAVIDFVAKQALEANNYSLFLNVNKYNMQAINFYCKHHFVLVKEETIDIGHGFIMDDYVFELTLNQAEQ